MQNEFDGTVSRTSKPANTMYTYLLKEEVHDIVLKY
jgi:hypothetical protein